MFGESGEGSQRTSPFAYTQAALPSWYPGAATTGTSAAQVKCKIVMRLLGAVEELPTEVPQDAMLGNLACMAHLQTQGIQI